MAVAERESRLDLNIDQPEACRRLPSPQVERSWLLIDTIPALAWSARTDGSAEFFNQRYLDYMGLSAEQAKDWGWTVAVHPDDLNGLAATWQRIMASEEAGEAEARLRSHDGEFRWFLLRVNPLKGEKGNIVRWCGVNTDIDDRRRVEAELTQTHFYITEAQRLSRDGQLRRGFGGGTSTSGPKSPSASARSIPRRRSRCKCSAISSTPTISRRSTL